MEAIQADEYEKPDIGDFAICDKTNLCYTWTIREINKLTKLCCFIQFSFYTFLVFFIFHYLGTFSEKFMDSDGGAIN